MTEGDRIAIISAIIAGTTLLLGLGTRLWTFAQRLARMEDRLATLWERNKRLEDRADTIWQFHLNRGHRELLEKHLAHEEDES